MPVVFYAFVGYFLAAMIVTYPLVASFGRAVSDPVDPILNTWIMAWEHHALLTQPLQFFNTNIFYPYTQTLLYSETLLVPSLLLLPVQGASGNAIFTHNLLVLLGFAMTGASGYLLGRWLFRNHWSGLVLGGVLAFNSYTLSNVGQAQLLHLEWLPLALLYLGKLLRQPRPRFALMLALFLAAQFYTVIYYGLFGFMVTGLVGGVGWLLRSYSTMRARWQALGLFVGAIVGALLLCLPLAIPYYELSERYGFERTMADAWPFSASLEMWMTSLPNNLVYGNVLGRELPKLGFYPVDALFPGALLLVVAALGLLLWMARSLVVAGPHDRAGWREGAFLWPVLVLAGLAFFFLLSLGPYPQGKSLEPNFDQLLPYAFVHQWVPGFQALRAPGRFAVVVFLGLAVASGYLIKYLRWRTVQFALLLLLFVEVLPVPSNALFVPTSGMDQQAAYAWLAAQPHTAFLELPVYPFGEEGSEVYWLESQFQSIHHWQVTPVGYSGFFPPRHDEFLRFVANFPKAETVHLLQAMGVEWVLIHADRFEEGKRQEFEASIAANGWETARWGDVWAVHLAVQVPGQVPGAQGASPTVRYFIPDVAEMGSTLALGEILMSGEPTPILPGSKLGELRVEWWQGERLALATDKVVQPPFYADPVAVASVAIPVPEESGLYNLRVFAADHAQVVASSDVNVVEDVAPPEMRLVPLAGDEASIVCAEGEAQMEVMMRTVGWYDEAFTLSARIVDGSGAEVGRSAADVEFPVARPRSNLLQSDLYKLPVDEVPGADAGALMVDLIAYRWQQEAARVVARQFVAADGSVVAALRLPLTIAASCDSFGE